MACTRPREARGCRATHWQTRKTLSHFTLGCVIVVTDVCFAAREPRIWHVLCVPKRRYVLVAAKSLHQRRSLVRCTSLMALP